MLGMRVDAAPRVAQIKRVPEEGSAGGFFEIERWPSKEDAITVWGGEGQHKDVRRLDAFFLHPRRSDVHLVSGWKIHLSWVCEPKKTTTDPTRMLIPPPVPVTQPK